MFMEKPLRREYSLLVVKPRHYIKVEHTETEYMPHCKSYQLSINWKPALLKTLDFSDQWRKGTKAHITIGRARKIMTMIKNAFLIKLEEKLE